MNMRAVFMNHGQPHAQPVWPRILLLTGIAAAAGAVFALQQLEQGQQQLEQMSRMLLAPAGSASRASTGKQDTARLGTKEAEEMKAVQAALSELRLPWQALFYTLEGISMTGIELLTVEPNPKLRRLRLTAEAADSDLMLGYVRNMGTKPVFKDVRLLSQERAESGAWRFVVEAAWLL